MIPQSLINIIERKLGTNVTRFSSVSGGSINHTFKLETSGKNYFLKYNDSKRFPGMFEAEAKGLQLLHSTNTVYIPEVLATAEAEGKSFLLLEWVEAGKRGKDFWKNFGAQLAKLHRNSSGKIGLDHNNYIGSLPQSNRQHSTWNSFFIQERLEPQLKLAITHQKLAHQLIGKLANLEKQLADIIPDEAPALLHGDLWSGNYITVLDGSACLVDPAVYYGHREMDLSMSRLFGGFDPEFYESYHEHFPLEKDFGMRIDVHNLYPLLVHVNLFGGSYIQQVNNILSKF